MGSLGVLDFWGFDWDSVVDHWDVLGSVPAASSVPGWSCLMVITLMVNWGIMSSTDLSVSGSVSSLGVLDLWGFHWDSLGDHRVVQWSVPLLDWTFRGPVTATMTGTDSSMSGKVGCLGSGNFRGVSWNVARANRGHQKHGSYHLGEKRSNKKRLQVVNKS